MMSNTESDRRTPPRPAPPPPLYVADRNFISKALIDDREVEKLRIETIRGCEAVMAGLGKLKDKPATLEHVLQGPQGVMKLLTASVNFDEAERAEKAMERLEKVLGPNGAVAEPRAGLGSDLIPVAQIREMVDGMSAAIEPYRRMLAQLKAGKQ